jgi:outer membrane protein OmpA-like peptidoglycan-associated protein
MQTLKLIASVLFIFSAILAQSQDEDALEPDINLVPNGSFEKIKGKISEEGQIEKASPWQSVSKYGTPDLFSKNSKEPKVGLDNGVGSQQPKLITAVEDGFTYAGLNVYSFKKSDEVPEYLQIKLKQKLTAGEQYYVEFWVSLADLSKHAINKMGAYFSANPSDKNSKSRILVKPQVENLPNRMLDDMENWQVICGEFTANGTEQYLTIGCFADESTMKVAKAKKPKGLKGIQIPNAYYYVDAVQVYKSSEMNDPCLCSRHLKAETVGKKMTFEFTKAKGEEEEKIGVKDLIESRTILFENNSEKMLPGSEQKLGFVSDLLNKNTRIKITIMGSADSVEDAANGDLKENRALLIRDLLMLNGVCTAQMNIEFSTGSGKSKEANGGNPDDRKVSFIVTDTGKKKK